MLRRELVGACKLFWACGGLDVLARNRLVVKLRSYFRADPILVDNCVRSGYYAGAVDRKVH